ncbi:soma ferritin [Halyomorpha halys]|uniref:soma ferritin n=1 Tax=Halyomorpha halys TaxID=286706 RepID=UPI0006D4DE67|nr:soma ferritin [Halyomorpha halys]
MNLALKPIFISDFYKCLTKLKPGYSAKFARNFADCGNTIKCNYDSECEKQINQQINQELYASYAYLSMAYHFEHPMLALPGFFSMFLFFSKEETEHAKKLIEFQNKRGGKVIYCDIKAFEDCDWTPESSVMKAIELEKTVTNSLHLLHSIASKQLDCHLCDFVEGEYLKEQYLAIKELHSLHSQLKRLNDGVGIHLLDKELYKKFKNKKIE